MPKLSVIYKAKEGDAKVTELYGHTFHDGKAEEVELTDEQAEKIKNNPAFQPGGKTPTPAPKETPKETPKEK
jgi:hypothetical protein